MENTALERTRATAKQAAAQIRRQQGERLKVTSEVFTAGDPKEVIIDTANQWGADLIMLGSHGLRGGNASGSVRFLRQW
jgi:nucleotide-binding universal stress UspA family protein